MSAIVSTLAVQAAKMAGEFLLEEYGDDAKRKLKDWIARRRGKKSEPAVAVAATEAEALDALEDGFAKALAELDRPYDDFFGPRVGNEPPAAEPPTDLKFWPETLDSEPDRSKLASGDRLFDRQNGTWTVWRPDLGRPQPQLPWRFVEAIP